MVQSPFRRRRQFDHAALVLGLGIGRQGLGWLPARGLGASVGGAPSAVAGAIAQTEGYGPAGNIPTIANNPGDLELGDIGYGVTSAAGGNKITNFPTAAAGWQALQNQITLMASGGSSVYSPSMTLAQVGSKYSGGSSSWASNVASLLGVDPSTNFASLVSGAAPAAQPGLIAASGDGGSSMDLSSLLSSTADNSSLYIGAGLGIAVIVMTAWALS